MPHYKLTYFKHKGRAELSRMIFAVAGQEFEDYRFERENWPDIKPTTPFGQVPFLEVDGKVLCQSSAIARYLALEFGLAGKDQWEHSLCDMVVGCVNDVGQKLLNIQFEQDVTKKEELMKKFKKDELPGYMDNFVKFLEMNASQSGYFVGDAMTWADLAFQICTEWMGILQVDGELEKYPKLLALKETVEAHPRVADWLENRPKTLF